MNDLHLKCKGCGEIDTIVDVDLVPREQGFTIGKDVDDKDYWNGIDEAFWESSVTVAHGCSESGCTYAHYQYGGLEWSEERQEWAVKRGPSILDIADVVVEVDGEYVAPTEPLGV